MKHVQVKVPLNQTSEILPRLFVTLTAIRGKPAVSALIQYGADKSSTTVDFVKPFDCVEVALADTPFRFYLEEHDNDYYMLVRALFKG